MKGVLKYLTFTAALAAGLLLSGCTVEDSGGKMVAVPFTLEVSGVVVDVAGHKPVGGAELVLTSYMPEDTDRTTPIGEAKGMSNADGTFKVTWKEHIKGTVHILHFAGGVVGGYNYRPYNMELNIYSGSPGYNSDSSTYTISDLVVNLERR